MARGLFIDANAPAEVIGLGKTFHADGQSHIAHFRQLGGELGVTRVALVNEQKTASLCFSAS